MLHVACQHVSVIGDACLRYVHSVHRMVYLDGYRRKMLDIKQGAGGWIPLSGFSPFCHPKVKEQFEA